jgi:hypothetical protein
MIYIFISNPTTTIGTCCITYINPCLVLVMFSFGTMKVIEYSVLTSANEMIYMPMNLEVRYLGKECVKFFGHKLGKSTCSIVLSAFSTYLQPSLATETMWTFVGALLWTGAMFSLSNHLEIRNRKMEKTYSEKGKEKEKNNMRDENLDVTKSKQYKNCNHIRSSHDNTYDNIVGSINRDRDRRKYIEQEHIVSDGTDTISESDGDIVSSTDGDDKMTSGDVCNNSYSKHSITMKSSSYIDIENEIHEEKFTKTCINIDNEIDMKLQTSGMFNSSDNNRSKNVLRHRRRGRDRDKSSGSSGMSDTTIGRKTYNVEKRGKDIVYLDSNIQERSLAVLVGSDRSCSRSDNDSNNGTIWNCSSNSDNTNLNFVNSVDEDKCNSSNGTKKETNKISNQIKTCTHTVSTLSSGAGASNVPYISPGVSDCMEDGACSSDMHNIVMNVMNMSCFIENIDINEHDHEYYHDHDQGACSDDRSVDNIGHSCDDSTSLVSINHDMIPKHKIVSCFELVRRLLICSHLFVINAIRILLMINQQ